MFLRSGRRRGAHVSGAWIAVVTIAVLASAAVAQGLPPSAADALSRGQQAAAEALASYAYHLPDSPLWTEALAAGTEAARLAPDHPAPRRFLAQAYLQVGWYARSWSAWQAYLDRGGGLDASVRRQLLEVATWMGLNAYDSGRRDQAVPYLETVVRLAPDDLGANARLARIHLDRDEPLEALPYLEALDGRAPELIPVLQRARRIERYGPDAAAAYASATEALDTGSLATAQDRFLQATALRPGFTDAWRGVATTAERRGRLQQARTAYEEVLALSPNDAGALAGLGRIALAEGAYETAIERFERAAELAPGRSEIADALARSRELLQERTATEEAQARAEADAAARAQAQAAEQAAAEQAAAEAAQAEAAQAEAAQADAATEPSAADQAAGAEREAEEQAAAEARAQEAARQAAAEQAEAERAAAERAAAAEEAARRAEAERAAAERAAAEQAAAEQAAADRAAAERAAEEAEARARAAEAGQPGGSLLLVDAVAEHRRSAAGPSPAVAFLPVPALADADLAGRTGDVIHLRVEVLDKPSDAPVLYQLCLVPADIAVRPACTDPDRLAFSGTGTYEGEQPWSGLAGFDGVDWQAGVDSVMTVLRRPDGAPLEPPRTGSDADDQLAAYIPMTVRIQALAVPAGAPFPGWP